MAASQFRIANGLKANGDITLTSIASGTQATNGKILVLDANNDVAFRTNQQLKSDLEISGTFIDTLTAGNGLTGGGTADSSNQGDITVTLGTPSTLTHSTSDGVTGTSHTHAITATADTSGGSESLLKSGSSGELAVAAFNAAAITGSGVMKTTDTTASTTTTTGSLQAAGGAGIAGQVTAGGALKTTDTTTSSSTSTGSLIAAGGAGIAENLHVGGTATIAGVTNIDDTTQSTSTTSGALVVDGGIGVAKDAYVGGSLVLTGNLTVSGTTTTVDSTTVLVADKNIQLGEGTITANSQIIGAGLNFTGHNGSAEVANAGFITAGDGTITINPVGVDHVLTLDPNDDVTLAMSGNLTVEGASIINQDLSSDSTAAAFATLTIATSLLPDASGGADIGSTSAEWGDIYLGDSKSIKFGADQDVTILHDPDQGLRINGAKSFQFGDADTKISQSADGQLDIDADTEIELTAPTVQTVVTTLDVDATTLDVDATTVDIAGNTTFSSGTVAITDGSLELDSVVTHKTTSTAIGTSTTGYIFQEAISSFVGAEVLVSVVDSAGTPARCTFKVLVSYDGSSSGGDSFSVYSVLGDSTLFETLTVSTSRSDGSGSDSGTGTHLALKIANGSGSNTIKVNHVRSLMQAFTT